MATVLIRSCSACGQAFGDKDGSWFINKEGVKCHACEEGVVGALVDMTLEAHQKLMAKSLIERGMATASTAVLSPIQCPLCGRFAQPYPNPDSQVPPSAQINWKNAYSPNDRIEDFKKYFAEMAEGIRANPGPPHVSEIPHFVQPYTTATEAAMAKISPPPPQPPPPHVEYYCDQCNVYWFSDKPELHFGKMSHFLKDAKGVSQIRGKILRMARHLSGLADSYPMPCPVRPWPETLEDLKGHGRFLCASCAPHKTKVGVIVAKSPPDAEIKLERMPPIHGHASSMTATCHSCLRVDFYRRMANMLSPGKEAAVLMASSVKESFNATEIAHRPQMRAAFAKCFGKSGPQPGDCWRGKPIYFDDKLDAMAMATDGELWEVQKIERETREDADVLELREKLRVALEAQA